MFNNYKWYKSIKRYEFITGQFNTGRLTGGFENLDTRSRLAEKQDPDEIPHLTFLNGKKNVVEQR